MAELVMLDLAGGPAFVEAVERVWASGDAVFPLDQRLPHAEAARVASVAAPTQVIGSDRERRRLSDGRPVEPGDALVVTTSGTTGTPKGVIHTHQSVRASAVATSDALAASPSTDRWLACIPVAHIGGFAVIARSLITGTPLEVHDGFDPARVDDASARGATLVSLVTRALRQVRTERFRTILLGGAAPPADRPENTVATWGMTETGSGCVYDGHPLDGVELRSTADGEIEVRAPMLLRAYRTPDGDHDPRGADGWFGTGDGGSVDPDGRLFIDGRRGDVINTGGEKVWPARIERIIAGLDGVAEVVVFGRPDDDWGHRVVAAVIIEDGHEPPHLDAVRQLVRDQLSPWHAPRELLVVDDFPRTALGKIRRNELR